MKRRKMTNQELASLCDKVKSRREQFLLDEGYNISDEESDMEKGWKVPPPPVHGR